MAAEVVGRSRERARIGRLIEEARGGHGAGLLITGDAGAGKTAMLEWAAGHADGISVLRAGGLEDESELGFAALHELLAPMGDRVARLPPEQATALRAALGLGAAAAVDPYGAFQAATALLADAADELSPLLLLIDDAQWIDGSSAAALRFAIRRLSHSGVAVLATAREGADTPLASVLEPLRLEGLDGPTAAALLERRGMPVSPRVLELLVGATAGNPLALLETVALLDPAQRAGREPVSEPLPAGASAERVFGRRLAELRPVERRVLLLAATSTDGALAPVIAAAGDGPATRAAFDELERRELAVRSAGRIVFAHPLLRGVVYHAAAHRERRAAHAALAAALDADGAAEIRAWHLGESVDEPDAAIAGVLEKAGERWRARGSPSAAANALERAARLTPPADTIGLTRRLVGAADAHALFGAADAARRLLDEVVTVAPHEEAHTLAAISRARLELWHEPRAAARLLRATAARVQRRDRDRGGRMLADAAVALSLAGDMADAKALGALARETAAGGPGEPWAEIAHAYALCLGGEIRTARPLLARAEARLRGGGDAPVRYVSLAALALGWDGCTDEALELLADFVAEARRRAAPSELGVILASMGEVARVAGRWRSGEAALTEALELTEQTEQRGAHTIATTTLAWLDAARGRESDCRRRLAEIASALERLALVPFATFAHAAEGLLELGLGHHAAAVAQLEMARDLADGAGISHPAVMGYGPDLVEAQVRVGRPADAARTLAALERDARAADDARTLAAVERCHGLLAPRDRFAERFEEALERHDGMHDPFGRARTQLCFGERLRRARRRAASRRHLHAALATFERLDASAWAQRARVALGRAGGSVIGERAAGDTEAALSALTPHELQVAAVVATGATNRQVGAQLFVSAKTVDYHLRNIYRKLGIGTRTELARIVAVADGASPPTWR